MGALRLDARHPQRCLPDATSDGYQLFIMVRCWVCVPVSDPEEELCVVEQVQLCDQCGAGQWDGAEFDCHLLDAAGAFSIRSVFRGVC